MKIQYFAEIVSEFSGFHHTPNFKASRSTGDFQNLSENSGKNSRRSSTESNHSIRIPVGVDHVPILPTPGSASKKSSHAHFQKHSLSSPSISRMASLSRVQEKLQRKLKRSESVESVETQRKGSTASTASYRLL
ncbi:Protein CBG17854 [Caenorhabditis briggsae]|uniref:Protein CBG17854 n=1 Tax=Caenorhabditis briggsae TaxID=6238 RepID=A8XRX3_CAEBR|nr:Protein CBG17854 [Caenorhabditis briggsae]CAP35399.1 Protein CBG17854 [Caenorhabditis briggsae]